LLAAILVGSPLNAVSPQSLEQSYRRGVEAYERSQWELAVQEFESLVKAGYHAHTLYYNLGNAYFRTKDVAGAVWAYERALQLAPGDRDTGHNLTLANLRVRDRITEPDIPLIVRLYRGLRGSLTPNQWAIRISWLLLISAGIYVGGWLLQRRWARSLSMLALTIAGLMVFLAVDSITAGRKSRAAIIYADPTVAYSAPSERSTALFELHAGAKVALSGNGDQWQQIELLDGKSGWVREESLRRL
jgi:tetratricopeptide (TPR) repeat protein